MKEEENGTVASTRTRSRRLAKYAEGDARGIKNYAKRE